MIAGYEDKRDAGSFCQLGCTIKKCGMLSVVGIITLVLVQVAGAKYDARLGNKVCGPCSSEVNLLASILTHIEDVGHDGGHIRSGSAVVTAALIDVTVGEEHTAKPHVLFEKEAVGPVVVGEHLEFPVVDLCGGRIGRHLRSTHGRAVHTHGGDESAETGAGG